MKLLALLALTLALAPALADHVYSHRYVIDGRLVGADGWPLPGREIRLAAEGIDLLETCREGSSPVTDERGDFRFCYHLHEIEPGGRVTATYGDASATRGVDVAFRRSHVLLREPNETGVEAPGWNVTYRISGRAWRPGPMELESVNVFGEAVVGLPVNLTVHASDGSTTKFASHTDGYGDFDLEVETVAAPDTLTLTLEALGRGQPTQLEPFFHRTYATIYVAPVGAPVEEGPATTPAATAFDDAPGSATPRINPVLVVALALGLVAAVLLSRRQKT